MGTNDGIIKSEETRGTFRKAFIASNLCSEILVFLLPMISFVHNAALYDLLGRCERKERERKKYISITINVDDGEGDGKLFFMFARRNACRYKYLISFFMLFKKELNEKAFEMDGRKRL